MFEHAKKTNHHMFQYAEKTKHHMCLEDFKILAGVDHLHHSKLREAMKLRREITLLIKLHS